MVGLATTLSAQAPPLIPFEEAPGEPPGVLPDTTFDDDADGWQPSLASPNGLSTPANSVRPQEPPTNIPYEAAPSQAHDEASIASQPIPPSESEPSQRGIRSLAALRSKLGDQSRLNYDRSLLTLTDHLENLALNETAAVRELPRRSGASPWPEVAAEDLQRALEPRLRELRRVVAQLEAFRQPAAIGADADLHLARYVLVDAQIQAARITGESGAIPRLLAERQTQAERLVTQRRFDYHILGTANLTQLSDALSLLNLTPREEGQLRTAALRQVEAWRTAGAGIGRNEALPLAQYARAEAMVRDGADRDSLTLIAYGLLEGELALLTTWDDQSRRLPQGTAAWHELTRTWQRRWQLHQAAPRYGLVFPEDHTERLDRDLQQLHAQAAQVRDRRGRLTPDLLRIDMLVALRRAERE
jgi:hypothetical protein